MTLEEVLDLAASPPPANYPAAVCDNETYAFTLLEQLEYRGLRDGPSPLAWRAQGWIGRDFDKFWWKSEGEALFDGRDEGESANDLLYSRLVRPFWNVQLGARYANGWASASYGDTWSAVLGVQGLSPYMFEIDSSLLLSEHGDISMGLEAEYSIRITQRLVMQPRTELAVYAQDIPGQNIGAGLSDASLDFRLRYEMKRELAPYLGVRFHWLVGETGNLVEAAGGSASRQYYLAGLRLAF